ncbi:hypothetical protein GR925_07200 [Streptomyces sp. HUCO-GS316]|uniref:hypothetical protein n=1 Tax=Streptomyces sp. HUCO-GS316 TaxID=2692198 RepID=UPI00136FC437|nr:hypothetical protein [Streptomyces sp. HUCO-GS316]MXM63241.1 hypothetical protein [Streptomyces sp. HUCO-GS316]
MSAGVLVRRAVRGATALRGGRVRRLTPYQVYGVLFWLVMTLAYWRIPLCCDAGLHAAVVERLKADLLHPAHPTADLPGAGSPYYGPYAVAQAVLARPAGLSGWGVVTLAGPVHLLVLLTGIGRFVRVLTPRPWAPVLTLLFMTLLWGTEPVLWSGSPGLMSLTTGLGYPSTLAIGLTLWAWALTGTRAREDVPAIRYVGPSGLGGWWGYAGIGTLYGLILLIHPGTALPALAGAAAIVAARQRAWRPPVAARWALTAAASLTVAVIWPYYDALAPAGDTGPDGMHRRLYEAMAGNSWLALTGLPALWLRAHRSARDPLALVFVLECLVVAYGRVSGQDTYAQALWAALLPLQCALAVQLTAPGPWGGARKALGAVAAVAVCAGFLTVHAGAVLPRSLDPVGFRQPPRWPTYEWAARHIGPGEVVLTDGNAAAHAIAGYGPNLLAPVRPDPCLDERERRRRLAEVRAYLSPQSTRAERTALARRRHVRWLLLTRWHPLPEEAVMVAWSRRTGEVLARVGG